MPKVGSLGLDMMTRTCTVQVNLDVADEADMVKKFRVSLALQPVATALFADSPFTEGQPNGYLSYRSHIWTDTDAGRTGMLDFVFEDGFGYERYVDYLLDVPMYFSYRDTGDGRKRYVDLAGQSFRRFMDGKLDAIPGQLPTLRDWSDHMTTAFPEVRLKQYLEMRGADGGRWSRLCALPAFWVGLLYDDASLDAAWDLVKDFSMAEHDGEQAFGVLAAEGERIGVADAGGEDAHQHFAGARRLDVDLDDLQGFACGEGDGGTGFHQDSSRFDSSSFRRNPDGDRGLRATSTCAPGP
jgi:glutamate--cysteine ligase